MLVQEGSRAMTESTIEIRLIGALEIVLDGGRSLEPAPRPACVLALLALADGAAVTTEALIDDLWGEEPPRRARNSIQTFVSDLRRTLGAGGHEIIESIGGGYRLNPHLVTTDVDVFERTLEKAMGVNDPAEQIAALSEALGLWRGEPLPKLAGKGRVHAAIVRLSNQRIEAIEALGTLELDRNGRTRQRAALQEIVAQHPYRERTVGLLARALYSDGRQSDALGVLADLRRRLREDLGLSPCRLIDALESSILNQDPALDARGQQGDAEPGHRSEMPFAVRSPTPLPVPASTFVGRSAEIDLVRQSVLGNRLVTIVGEGGLGKTRLAIEVGRRLTSDVSVIGFADLAPRSSNSTVVDEICRSVGLLEISGDPVEALRMRLGSGPALLIFDNCEHVLDAIAELTGTLLETCTGLRVLATSRHPLNVSGERRYILQPLTVEDDAVALLKLRAEESGLAEPIADQESVALCCFLDGIPLAIELAASWLRILEPLDLLDRLEKDMSMIDGSQSGSKTMAQTIEWSLGRLTATESAAFDTICEFPAGVSIDQAERVLGPEALATIARLVDSALLRTTYTDSGRRYRQLEPIRAIGLARVATRGDRCAGRRTQASVMSDLASAIGGSLPSADETAWRTRLEEELPNMAAAVSWAVEADPLTAIELVLPLAPLVSFVPAGGARLAIPVAELIDWWEFPGGLAAAALGLFAKAYLDADPTAAPLAARIDNEIDRLERTVDPSVLIHVATVRTVMNDPIGAIALYREASERGREVGQPVTVAEALMLEGAWQWFTQSDMNDVGIRECSRIATELGGPSLISLCEVVNGFAALDDDPNQAETHFRQALDVNAPTGYGPGVAEFMLGFLHARRGRCTQALTLIKASLERFIGAGLQIEVGMALGGLTGALLELRQEPAARFAAEVLDYHYPPIAAMRTFGQHIDHAREATTGALDVPGRRDEAITGILALTERLLASTSST